MEKIRTSALDDYINKLFDNRIFPLKNTTFRIVALGLVGKLKSQSHEVFRFLFFSQTQGHKDQGAWFDKKQETDHPNRKTIETRNIIAQRVGES